MRARRDATIRSPLTLRIRVIGSRLAVWLEVHLPDRLCVDRVEPGPVATIGDDALHHGPVVNKTSEPSPCGHIPLAANPEDAEASLPEPFELLGTGADMPVSRDDDQLAVRHSRNPLWVKNAKRTFGNQLVSDVDSVPSRGLQRLEAKSALVNVEA